MQPCNNSQETFITMNGRQCPGCPICLDGCPQLFCPAIKLTCANPQRSYTIVNGKQCPGCFYCPTDCQPVPCPMIACTSSQLTVETVNTASGKQCSGCPICGPLPVAQV